MAPKQAVSKQSQGAKCLRTGGDASTSHQPQSSRRHRTSPREGNPTQPADVHEQELTRRDAGVKLFDLKSLPDEVDGRKVPAAKFQPQDLPTFYFGGEERKFKFYTSILGRSLHVQVKDWVGATLLKRMGVRMSQYIEEMDAHHEMEASEEEEEETEEGEEGGGQEKGHPDETAPMDAGGSAERASSPPELHRQWQRTNHPHTPCWRMRCAS